MSNGIRLLERRLLIQYLLVFLSFFLMVMISNRYAGDIVNKHLVTYGEEAITASAETLQTYLEGHQTTFEDVAYVVEDFYGENAGLEEIEEELVKWNTRLHGNDARYQGFLYIYGVIDGQFVEGSSWEDRSPDYDPFTRPWYIGAVERNGQTYYCDPYIDARTDEWILSLSRVLRDADGTPFGVLAFDVFLSTIADYVDDMHLMNGGYGVLLDSEMRFIVHPDASVFEQRLDDYQSERAAVMRENDSLNAHRDLSIAGVDSVLFSRKLFNGWYLYVSAPYNDYYKDVNVMFTVLSLTGLAATVMLCGILAVMHRAKARSDEENRAQSSLLERANAQAATESEAHRRAKSMLDATPFGCKIWDRDLNIFDCNKEAVKLFGLTDEREFMDRFYELSPKIQPDGALSAEKAAIYIQKAFQDGRLVFEWMHQLLDGTPLPSEITLVRVDYGEDVAVAGYIRDLREYKHMMAEIDKRNEIIEDALHEAQHASKAKSEFLSNMSHEIRTPMNAVLGMAELLLHEPLTPRQRNYVDDIHVSGQSLLAIINDILDMSKIEAGKLELTPVHYDFRAFLDHLKSMFRYVAEKKQIGFEFEAGPDLPAYLFGDDIRLRQVLTNICGNAVKFTQQGYVRLKVAGVNGQLLFEIKDTGMGIKKEDMGKLFSAFSQVDTHKNRSVVGTGLGLAISKSFVEMMGGQITFDSEYGQGTVFTVMLPIVEGNEEDVRYEEKKQKVQSILAPDAQILVVDDNEFNLKVAVGLLGLSGIDAATASSGKEAIDMVTQNRYDLVFMDHMMPEMDGVEATAAIRKLGGAYADAALPIIALTANAVFGAKGMFLANGFNGFISKPIDLHELNDILKQWLPPDKIKQAAEPETEPSEPEASATGAASATEEIFLNALDGVPEIDKDVGLSHVQGAADMYQITVELFHNSLMRECGNMTALLEGGDVKGFATAVHAMKSMLSTVGAMKLSEMALDLELAAKKDEAEYCRDTYPTLLEQLQALHEKLAAVFSETGTA